MSFDPITLALTKPKVVDLTKFAVNDAGNTINDVVLVFFSNGGGSSVGSLPDSFWEAVNTDRAFKIRIDASAMGVIIETPAQTVQKLTDGTIVAIETSFMVYVDGWHKVTIVFGNVAAAGNVSLMVTVIAL